ncbi:MAG: TAXI family TRAP transporter solute-binding subunit [Deltaproteobacteria bacterium]|nr:TAXI family TRAP transporter solute-binding subunit [Deltaproteobacteria bacterium]
MLTRASVLAALLATLALAGLGCSSRPGRIRIAAGTQGSGVYEIGAALAELFDSQVPGCRARVVEGSSTRNSLQQLAGGEADLAVAFSDSQGDGNIRTLAPLHELYLYMVVWEEAGIVDVPSFKGHRVGIGPAASGTAEVSRQLLGHYRLGESEVTLVSGGYGELANAFLKRQLDALFVLGSIESSAVERILRAPGAELLSLDDPSLVAPAMDGIRTKHPFVVSHVVPKHLFGAKPKQPTGVIGVNALLVARAGLPDETARLLTQALFQHRVDLIAKVPRLREISERFEPNELRFPLHPGAAQYYRRDEPPLIQKWADVISLLITMMVLAWSAVIGITARRRQKRKGLLDEFYAEFRKIARDPDESTPEPELREARASLQGLRHRVFDALMAGRVEANSAFVVFHDYLRADLQQIERLLRERQAAPEGAEEAD